MHPERELRNGMLVIQHPSNWCKRALARNEDDEPVDPVDDDACQWCMQGALDYGNSTVADETFEVLAYVINPDKPKSEALNVIADFQDDERTTHEMVMAKFKEAIEYLQTKGHENG